MSAGEASVPDDLYERDIYAWAQHQGALLRRMQAGERVNELDWDHVIEEVEDVGRSEMLACRSLLARALDHLLKLRGWPESQSVQHWLGEAQVMLRDAQAAFSPSMRQHIDVARLYAGSRRDVMRLRYDGQAPLPTPADNPFTLDDLLAEDADIDALLAKLAA